MLIHRVPLRLSNAYIVEAERTVIVDTGSPGEERKILDALAQRGIDHTSVSLLLHTHGHSDHAGSTAALAKQLSVPVAVHSADADMLRSGKNRPLAPLRLSARILKLFVDVQFAPSEPTLCLTEGQRLDDFGLPARILDTPGHTAGSISILFDNGDAIVGDLVMGGHLGGMICPTKPRWPYFAEDKAQLRPSLKHLMKHATGTVYVGHGGPLNAEDIQHRIL